MRLYYTIFRNGGQSEREDIAHTSCTIKRMKLYHTGFLVIRDPDIHYGRKNADFGQGFYLSPEKEFACRWARERKGQETVLNEYELDTEGLKIKRFVRDEEWFSYIFNNRRAKEDSYSEYDVIVGPIANDTLYDTWGILTSGLIPDQKALELLQLGPEYTQWVIKSEKAKEKLQWCSSKAMSSEEIAGYRQTVAEEEKEYQRLFTERL